MLNYEPYSGVCEQMPGSDIPVWFCKYFVCTKWEISGKRQLPIDESSFLIVICIEGMGEIQICEEKLEIKRGECVFVPAGEVTLNLYGELTILSVRM